jgi:hypothetical protein
MTVWATPYELVHGERFPDASVVVLFGCAALILLDTAERTKFQSRCVLMLFMHYADKHPLFTYAFYSSRIVYRQDCIFLPTVFPMRQARSQSQSGLHPDGEPLVTYRSPAIMRDCPPDVSFASWTENDPLPVFDDDVAGFDLFSPGCFPDEVLEARPPDHPCHCPDRMEFAPSFVNIPAPTVPGQCDSSLISQPVSDSIGSSPRRSSRVSVPVAPDLTGAVVPVSPSKRKPVKERWLYEPIATTSALATRGSVDVSSVHSVMVAPASRIPEVLLSTSGGDKSSFSASSSSSNLPVGSGQTFLLSSVHDSDLSIPLPTPLHAHVPSRFPAYRGESFNVHLSYPAGSILLIFTLCFRQCLFQLCVVLSLACFTSTLLFSCSLDPPGSPLITVAPSLTFLFLTLQLRVRF